MKIVRTRYIGLSPSLKRASWSSLGRSRGREHTLNQESNQHRGGPTHRLANEGRGVSGCVCPLGSGSTKKRFTFLVFSRRVARRCVSLSFFSRRNYTLPQPTMVYSKGIAESELKPSIPAYRSTLRPDPPRQHCWRWEKQDEGLESAVDVITTCSFDCHRGSGWGHLEPEALSPRASGVLVVDRTAEAKMSRRPSWVVGGAATTRVDRTPSGLPLCSICHKELGFCSHTPIFRNRRWSTTTDGPEASTAVSAAAESGAAVRDADTVPSALSINAPDQSGESNPLEDYLRQRTKRRRPATLEDTLEKGKRREILTQPTVRARVALCEITQQKLRDTAATLNDFPPRVMYDVEDYLSCRRYKRRPSYNPAAQSLFKKIQTRTEFGCDGKRQETEQEEQNQGQAQPTS